MNPQKELLLIRQAWEEGRYELYDAACQGLYDYLKNGGEAPGVPEDFPTIQGTYDWGYDGWAFGPRSHTRFSILPVTLPDGRRGWRLYVYPGIGRPWDDFVELS